MQIGDEAYYIGEHPGKGWIRDKNPSPEVANTGGFWVFETARQVYEYSRTMTNTPQVYKVLIGEVLRDDVASALVPGSVKTSQICIVEELNEKSHS